MAAYIVARGRVSDLEVYRRYAAEVPGVIAAHGGRYVVRGGAITPLEGADASDLRHVIIEFPSMAALRAFWDSPAYSELRALRQTAASLDIFAIEGV